MKTELSLKYQNTEQTDKFDPSNEFFVIETFNLNSVTTRLYGYAFAKDNARIIQSHTYKKGIVLDVSGSFILIETSKNTITITQDLNGSYGLYLYENNDYFAISNSFFKLVNFLLNKTELTFNKEYADEFLFASLSSSVYNKTLINEISFLPRNSKIIINKINKTLKINEIDLQENTIPIDSKEALKILDNWYNKWVNIFRSIRNETNNITFDLSGGFDSRIVAAIWLTSNICLDKLFINSHKLKGNEDYIIASKIAKDFNFKLNENFINEEKITDETISRAINNSFNIKLGFHKEMYFKTFRYKNTTYTCTGAGGESLRGYPNKTPTQYLNSIKYIYNTSDPSLTESTINTIKKTFKIISKKFNIDLNTDELIKIHYKELRNRNHFGKTAIETYLSNMVTLTPLIDEDLRKLKLNSENCNDDSLLFALILDRYCPKLLDYDFEGNREISKDTINYAKKLNKNYKFTKPKLTYILGPSKKINPQPVNNNHKISREDVERYIENLFFSNNFKSEFNKYFSMKSYYKIAENIKAHHFDYLSDVYAAISIILIGNMVRYNQLNNENNSLEWLNMFREPKNRTNIENDNYINEHLLKFITARIDIKNIGNEKNTIEILEKSDENAYVDYPNWFCGSNGEGLVIMSTNSPLKLKLKCINDGKLIIYLRGPDIKDRNNKRLPIFIDFTKANMNNTIIFDKHQLVSHDNPYIFKKSIKNSEIINLTIDWMPLNKLSAYDDNLVLNK